MMSCPFREVIRPTRSFRGWWSAGGASRYPAIDAKSCDSPTTKSFGAARTRIRKASFSRLRVDEAKPAKFLKLLLYRPNARSRAALDLPHVKRAAKCTEQETKYFGTGARRKQFSQ